MTTATVEPKAAEKPAKTLKLPDALRSYEAKLLEALATSVPHGEWPEGVTYRYAEQPEAIARVLVQALHDDLKNAQLRCVYRKKLNDRDRTRLAQASKVGGKLNFFTEIDLLIEVNWEQWILLSDERRIALIDHELCHFSLNIDDEGAQSYVVLSHDLEEFRAIVDRWGLWSVDVQRFAHSMERGKQLDIFATVDKGAAS